MSSLVLNNTSAPIVKGIDYIIPFQRASTKKINLVANAPIQVVAVNLQRIHLIIANLTDQLVWLYFGDSAPVVGGGLPLYDKRSFIQIDQTMLYRGQIAAISEFATSLSIVECVL